MLRRSIGTPQASGQGHSKAQYSLGMMYANGWGVGRSEEQAYEWIQRAAQGGHADAQNDLALIYLQGKGVGNNVEKALEMV